MSSSAQSARDLSKRHKHSAVICRSHTLAIHLNSQGNSCDARSVRLTESATSGPRSCTFLCTARQNIISATSSTLSKICWERQRMQRIAWSIRERIPPTLWQSEYLCMCIHRCKLPPIRPEFSTFAHYTNKASQNRLLEDDNKFSCRCIF
jgi:hypothetical protein